MKQGELETVLTASPALRWRRYLIDSVLAIAGVALVTGLIVATRIYPRVPTISLMYLLVVLALASVRGLYAAILASLLAFAAYDFFLVTPFYTFLIPTVQDLLTLVVLLATAIITGQLAAALRRRAEQAQSREREIRSLYEKARELAALQERQRLARELHDSVSQVLYGISLGAHTAREAFQSDPEQALASLDYVLSLSEAGLVEMRALIFELRPESLETEGLVAALNRQVAALRTRHHLDVQDELAIEPPLPVEQKQAIYRIVQEALHNIIRHARCTSVSLRLVQHDNEICLSVRDNGRGFDPAGPFPGHLGLHSMKERADTIGALLTIESSAGQGTSITLRLPLTMEAKV